MGYTMKHKQGHFPFKACPGKSSAMKQVKTFINPEIGIKSAEGESDWKFNPTFGFKGGLTGKRFSIGGLLDYTVKQKTTEVPSSAVWSDTGLPVMSRKTEHKPDIFGGGTFALGAKKDIGRSGTQLRGVAKGTATYGAIGRSKGKFGFTGGGKISIGGGGATGCQVGTFGCSEGSASWDVGLYGEHGSKHSLRPGTRVGLSGKYDVFKGSVGYDVKSKKPSYRLGLSLDI